MSGVAGWKLCINCRDGFRPKEGRNQLMCLRCFEFSDIGEKPEKPCNLCGYYFQPTDARRMLCKDCFKGKGYPTQGYLNRGVKEQ